MKHPLYYLSLQFPIFRNFISQYEKKYGLVNDVEQNVCNILKREKKVDICIFPVVDYRFIYLLETNEIKNLYCIDFNQAKVNLVKTKGINALTIGCLNKFFTKIYGDVLVSGYLLEALEPNLRETFILKCKNIYKNIIFFGKHIPNDIPALGPEPIGTHGCRKYNTNNIKAVISSNFESIIQNNFYDELGDLWYLYHIT